MPEQALTTPETPPVEAPPPIVAEGEEGSTPADDSTPEQKEQAREQGWRDLDEYQGQPDKFVSAKEYLDRADHILPILRSRERESKAEISRLRQEMEDLRRDSKQAVEMANARARKEVADRYEALKTQRAQAVTDGDGAEFNRLDGEMRELLREAEPKKADVPPDNHPPELKAASTAFLDRNKWFNEDPRKNRMAVIMSQEIIAKQPHLKNNPEFFPELERQLRKEYPEMFGNPKRAAVDPMVEGDARPAGTRSVKKGFRDLPKDAQDAARRQVKNGFCKTEQEYADIYFETYGE
jgi:hypothetical protein